MPTLATPFTDLVGCTVPVQLAGLGGGIGTPQLAIAVARAGGLGQVGHGMGAAALGRALDVLGDPGPGAVGASFLVPFLEVAAVEAAAARVRVVDFFWGEPDAALVARASAGGALVCWQVGSAREAQAAVDAGCDLVAAQGFEAGGHVRGELALLPLLDEVLARVHVPVLAAGGIATGRALAAVLAAGASGARIGTRFVAARESGAHPAYVEALLAASGADTVVTQAFCADWPDAPHRVLRAAVEAAAHADDTVATVTTGAGRTIPVRRWSSWAPTRAATGAVTAMALYAGQGVGEVRARQPAGQVVSELVEEAAALLAR